LRGELSGPCPAQRREEIRIRLEALKRDINRATHDAQIAGERENALRPALREIERRATEQQEQSQRAELLERRAKARAALTSAEAEWAAADQAFENFIHQKLHRQLTMKGDQL
jgi:DNA repair exonuclease SbcCD ATPase subunit